MSILQACRGGWAHSPGLRQTDSTGVFAQSLGLSPGTQSATLQIPNAVAPEVVPNPTGARSRGKPMCYLEALGLLRDPTLVGGGRSPQPPWGCLGRAGQAPSQEAARPGDPTGHPRLNGDPEESWEEPPRPGLSFAKTPRLGMKCSPPSLRTPRRPPGPRVPPQEGDTLGCGQPSRGQHGTAVGVMDLLVSVLPAQRTQTNYIYL